MVLWNEESTVDLAIESVKNLVDEIVIVDNMSTDNTLKIAVDKCEELNIPYKSYSDYYGKIWNSRKKAIDNSSGEWIIILDGDHVIDERMIPKIKKICERILGFIHLSSSFRNL